MFEAFKFILSNYCNYYLSDIQVRFNFATYPDNHRATLNYKNVHYSKELFLQ